MFRENDFADKIQASPGRVLRQDERCWRGLGNRLGGSNVVLGFHWTCCAFLSNAVSAHIFSDFATRAKSPLFLHLNTALKGRSSTPKRHGITQNGLSRMIENPIGFRQRKGGTLGAGGIFAGHEF